ncbi:uncharacterized protein LOC131256695 isoform X2 [Magnolia sinica]|uniref:uncharacterized protein LOC131256695 isoform X2 n=1 Tax=Magnolia sinica TaxID=86752 RepID=UPI00265B1E91|nr:uncharacterized protein LOC131256695 isoform X2 [Magnolia sinica]
MEGKQEPLPNPNPKFPAFPFEPYPIQIDFMNALYQSLQKGGVAMLESPTGTGKTLSIICSALQWAVDQRSKNSLDQNARKATEENSGNPSDDEPDWMRDFSAVEIKKTRKLGFKSRNFDERRSRGSCGIGKKEKEKRKDVEGLDEGDAEFLVEDYESGEDGMMDGGDLKRKAGRSCFSSSDDDDDDYEDDDGGGEGDGDILKVYFCSRTHSQLSQFVKELKRTVFSSEMKVVCLGSRKNFCINADILKLGNSTRINEQCLELQKNKNQKSSKIKIQGDGGRIRQTKSSSGCPMLHKQKLQKQFRDEVCQRGALDMEDLVQLGKKIGTCPYYGSRSMVPTANLVVLPYQSLLLKSARELLGLNLKNSVVIIDEAHNLADSLTNMYNTKVTLSQLEQVHSHLEAYLDRFRNQLGAANLRYIQTLMVITRAFLRLLLGDKSAGSVRPCCAEEASGEKSVRGCSMAINDFLFSLDIDNINMVKLVRYIKESNIVHKVSGYGTKLVSLQLGSVLDNGGNSSIEGSSLLGFQSLVDFLLSLTNNDGDGRVIISRPPPTCSGQQEEGYLKYVMLAGEKIFSEIVDQAHAVVLAGGTLQPIEETKERLFPCLPRDQFHFFSCNHIVPPESILPIAVSRGPSGSSFDFSYNSRSSARMIEELGRLLCNLVGVVPEGIVVFFSSFEYEGQVYDAWKASGTLARILKKKRVFREPRSNMDVEAVLKEYKEAITLAVAGSREDSIPHGALLLAVVGGKISEGINFSDGMGRCVVMVGLPYPSPSDVELMERVKHIEGLGDSNATRPAKLLSDEISNENTVQSGFDILRSCKRRGREYYENLCMKAVNQSIGRAIRHINDYAAILLVDSRYSSNPSKGSFSHATNKLPQWIKCRLVSVENYGEVHRLLHQFFKLNKQRQC